MKTENRKSESGKAETNHRMMTSPLANSHARNVIPSGVQRGPASTRDVIGRKPGVDVRTAGTGGFIKL